MRLIYAAMNIDRSTEEGWLADSFQQIIDEAKSRATSRDTRRSMMQAAGEGFFMGGRVPFGYQAVPAPGTKPNGHDVTAEMTKLPPEVEAAIAAAHPDAQRSP